MNTELPGLVEQNELNDTKQLVRSNGFGGGECVLKTCCKKYKKGKRCKKCPDR